MIGEILVHLSNLRFVGTDTERNEGAALYAEFRADKKELVAQLGKEDGVLALIEKYKVHIEGAAI